MQPLHYARTMVPPAGLEPAFACLKGRCLSPFGQGGMAGKLGLEPRISSFRARGLTNLATSQCRGSPEVSPGTASYSVRLTISPVLCPCGPVAFRLPQQVTDILLGRLLPDDSFRAPGTVPLPPIGTCLSPRSDCPFHPDSTGSSLLL